MAVLFSLFVFTLTYISTQARSVEDAKHGCTAPNALPNLPFFVIWNIPSTGCENHGIDLNLTAYGIVNNNKDLFMGEMITIFYNMGPWPHYSGNKPVNGGLPQEGNLKNHLSVVKQNVEKYIPNANFDGLGVIDFESWRPHLQMNFGSLGVYIKESMALVKKEHPTWTDQKQITAEATRQFDTAARSYIQTTLQETIQTRPHGYWGYYGYPRCWGPATANVCAHGSAETNDQYLGWLFSTSTGLYPRIYTNRQQPIHSRYLYVREQVNETQRVQVKWSNLNVPIMPYSLDQDSGTDFFQKADLQIAIEEPADMGASGVVIWGSSGYFHTRDECNLMKDNIKNVLGPFVKNLTDVSAACALQLCNNHGRCVRKDYEAATQDFLRLYDKKSCVRPREEYENISSRRQGLFGENLYRYLKKYDNYVCRCLAGWHGEYCDKPAW